MEVFESLEELPRYDSDVLLPKDARLELLMSVRAWRSVDSRQRTYCPLVWPHEMCVLQTRSEQDPPEQYSI